MDINETNFNLTDEQNIYELYQNIIESPDYLAACKCGPGARPCGYDACCQYMGSGTVIRTWKC